MARGKPKGRYNFDKDKNGKEIGCEYENGTWCDLPKFKRCKYCIRCANGDKACEVSTL